MNFEDEEYVRVYSKETITYKRLGWEGRAVFWHLLLKADRAGVIELDENDDLVEAVASLIDMPEAIVRVGLERLASRGVTSRHGASLIIDRFVEAQEARRSDRLRAQDYRDRKRASSPGETLSSSRIVTANHDSSLPASPPLPSPCPASPPPAKEIRETRVPVQGQFFAEPDEPEPSQPDTPTRAEAFRIGARTVFEAWKTETNHPRAELDAKREARIVARLRDGFTPEQLILAVRQRRNDPWLMGSSGRIYDGISVLLRDREQVERLIDLTQPIRSKAAGPPPRQPNSGYSVTAHAREIT